MADAVEPGPSAENLSSVFHVTEVAREEDRLLYYGDPIAPREVVIREVWPQFHERGYEVTLSRRGGRHVLVAEPIDVGIDGVPWTNLLLLVATVLTTTFYAGARWYYIPFGEVIARPVDTLATVWPFAAAVLGVLAVHESGHYVMSRYHRVDATLPYFIPVPNFIGTMGAVIRMKGQMPSRKALFDIGVAGPLAGLVATVVVTAIGLLLPPIQVPAAVLASEATFEIHFGEPLLMRAVAFVVGQPIGYADPALSPNPVVYGGWVGMFITFLNLLPVGQLDGGHILRALIGDRQPTVAAVVPGAVFAWAGYLYYVREIQFGATMWVVLGVLTLVVAYLGPATPIDDGELGTQRKALGVFTFFLGALCFMPVPIQFVA